MAISKLSKLILFILLGVFLTILSIIAFTIYVIENPYIDSSEIQKCEESKFVANGGRIFVDFDRKYQHTFFDQLEMTILNKNKIKFNKSDSSDVKNNSFYFDDKILKTDTLLIKLKNKEFRLYDFKNECNRQRAGKEKGVYHCGISSLKINSKTDSLYGSNVIFLAN